MAVGGKEQASWSLPEGSQEVENEQEVRSDYKASKPTSFSNALLPFQTALQAVERASRHALSSNRNHHT